MASALTTASALLAMVSCGWGHARADLVAIDVLTHTPVARFRAVQASFGHAVPDKGLRGVLMPSNPRSACQPIQPAPEGIKAFALIVRGGGCSFTDKVDAAKVANYTAAVIYNVHSDHLLPMGGDDDDAIPSLFIGATDADFILRRYIFPKHPGYAFVLTPDDDVDLNAYILPFLIVAGICLLIMIGIVVAKCIQDYKRKRRHRLPKSALKKLPVIKFKPGDPYETCCICLDDFEEGDKLRILPCDHGYHAKCIDPWLVKNKRICPQCRKRVFPPGTVGGSSRRRRREPGSSRYDDDTTDTEQETTDESAPLLAGGTGARPRTSGAGPSGYGGMAATSATAAVSATPENQATAETHATIADVEVETERRRARREERRARRRERRHQRPAEEEGDGEEDATTGTNEQQLSDDQARLVPESPSSSGKSKGKGKAGGAGGKAKNGRRRSEDGGRGVSGEGASQGPSGGGGATGGIVVNGPEVTKENEQPPTPMPPPVRPPITVTVDVHMPLPATPADSDEAEEKEEAHNDPSIV